MPNAQEAIETMDLLTTVRKEGSRGGRGDFKWSDVESSTHRENYLGHSLMAPVGRWQKGRDLDWYTKGDTGNKDGETDAERAARERKEEIKRVKEAEQDALARALGFEVAPRNPNMEALGNKKEVDRVLKEAAGDEGGQGRSGVGFGSLGAAGPKRVRGGDEKIEGTAEKQDAELSKALREYKRRHGDDAIPERSNDKDHGKRRHRHHGRDRDREYRRRSRSRSGEHHRSRRDRSRSRSRSRDRRSRGGRYTDNEFGRGGHKRDRSRSPRRSRHDRDDRDERYRRNDYDKRK